jgi:hypothetical protein
LEEKGKEILVEITSPSPKTPYKHSFYGMIPITISFNLYKTFGKHLNMSVNIKYKMKDETNNKIKRTDMNIENIPEEKLKEILQKNTFGNKQGKRLSSTKTITDKTKTGQIRTTIPRTLATIKKIDKGDILEWDVEGDKITITKVENK